MYEEGQPLDDGGGCLINLLYWASIFFFFLLAGATYRESRPVYILFFIGIVLANIFYHLGKRWIVNKTRNGFLYVVLTNLQGCLIWGLVMFVIVAIIGIFFHWSLLEPR